MADAPPSELHVTVPGEPVPTQPAAVVNGRVATKGRGRQTEYRERVRIYTMLAVNKCHWRSTSNETYSVVMRAFVGNSRTIDVDNIAKGALDGLKTIAFPDDRQVVDLRVVKALDATRPRLEVTVVRLTSAG